MAADLKARWQVEAIKGERSIAEIASDFGVHSNMVGQWKKKVLETLPQPYINKSVRIKEGCSMKKYIPDHKIASITYNRG